MYFNVLQLPLQLSISDGLVAGLAPLFGPNTLETVALQRFGVTEAQAGTWKHSHIDGTGFKGEFLYNFMNKGNDRKVQNDQLHNVIFAG